MARLVFAPQAIDDLRDVRANLAERAGQPTADKHTEQFRSTFERLVAHPRSGSPERVSAATFVSLLFGLTLSSIERKTTTLSSCVSYTAIARSHAAP